MAAVNANKVALAVGHERRFEPPILDLMRTVRSGELANLEAFADAAEGRAPYLIARDEMVATIAGLEAIVESAATGRKVMVN